MTLTLVELIKDEFFDSEYKILNPKHFESKWVYPQILLQTYKAYNLPTEGEIRDISTKKFLEGKEDYYEDVSENKEITSDKLLEKICDHTEKINDLSFFNWHFPFLKKYWKIRDCLFTRLLFDNILLDGIGLATWKIIAEDYNPENFAVLLGGILGKTVNEIKRNKIKRGLKEELKDLEIFEKKKNEYENFIYDVTNAKIEIISSENAGEFVEKNKLQNINEINRNLMNIYEIERKKSL